jgi:hypothetical protein
MAGSEIVAATTVVIIAVDIPQVTRFVSKSRVILNVFSTLDI